MESYWQRKLNKFNFPARTTPFSRKAENEAVLTLARRSHGEKSETTAPERSLAETRQSADRNRLETILKCSLEFTEGRASFQEVFSRFLEEILSLTCSEYGFLAEVHRDEKGAPYMRTHAITNIAWDAETRALFSAAETLGMEFRSLDTLFGAVLAQEEVIISNDPSSDPRAGGLPEGHPPLNAFLGIPVFGDRQLLGVIGLGNRPGGYDMDLVGYISPIIATFASYLVGWQNERDRRAIEEELSHAALLISTLVDVMPSAVIFEDPSRRIQYLNRQFLDIFGVNGSPNALLGMDSGLFAELVRGALVAPDDYLSRVEKLVSDGVSVQGDIVHFTNGKVYERDFTVVAAEPHVVGYLWKFREVSAWRKEYELMASLFRGSMDAVIIINAEGEVKFWNSRAEEFFGYSALAAVGKLLEDLIVPPRHKEAHRLGLKRFMATRESQVLHQVISIEAMHRAGHTFEIEMFITCIEQDPEPRYSAFIRPKSTT